MDDSCLGKSSGDNCLAVYQYRIDVLLNKTSGWVVDEDYSVLVPFDALNATNRTYWTIKEVRDVNRDGLADIVTGDSYQGDRTVFINTGKKGANYTGGGDYGSVWKMATNRNETPPWPVDQQPNLVNYGDIDGDGQLDVLTQAWNAQANGGGCNGLHYEIPVTPKLNVATGRGWGSPWTSGYQSALVNFRSPWTPENILNCDLLGNLAPGGYSVVDLNADGLADLVVSHGMVTGIWPDGSPDPGHGGQALINTGTAWVDLNGKADWDHSDTGANYVPIVPVNWRPEAMISIDGTRGGGVPLDTFIDVNGDGIPDHVTSYGGLPAWEDSVLLPSYQGTWLNKFTPPVIDTFPTNSLAKATSVEYKVISTSDAVTSGVYTDTDAGTRPTGTRHFTAPLRVVSLLSTDDGVGSVSTVSYKYWDLRASATGRGPQGFAKIQASESPSGMITTTDYAQTYPYTGRPIKVSKSNQGPLTTTVTNYCYWLPSESDQPNCSSLTDEAVVTPGKPVFVYPGKVTDTTYLRTSQVPETGKETITTTTEYVYDKRGNPTTTTVTTVWSTGESGCSGNDGGTGGTGGTSSSTSPANNCGETYQKKITNTYGEDGSDTQFRGKITHMEVATTKLAPLESGTNASITHKTDFEYRTDGTLGLTKKIVEKGALSPIELHTAFDYDRFGNLILTRECASDFDSCGTTAPVSSDKDHDPPFRTTTTSYEQAAFTPPTPAGAGAGGSSGSSVITSLSYGDGRFPVKTTNAVGHVQYSAYDPLLGVVVQSTGPNGVYTCYGYDVLGWKTSETARCGSAHPLTTTMERYRATADSSKPLEKLVTVTRVPTSSSTSGSTTSSTWIFADALGRGVRTLTRAFDGGFSETGTMYDYQGNVSVTWKPKKASEAPLLTYTDHDALGRPSFVTQTVGVVDGTSAGAGDEQVTSVYTVNPLQAG